MVERGQPVLPGAVIARLDTTEAQALLSSAEARIAQARAELEVTESGGRPSERAAVESSLKQALADLEIAQREYDSLRRLQEKNAATAFEVNTARDRLEKVKQQIAALEQKRSTLVAPSDRAIGQARLRDAQAAADAARQRASAGIIRTPMGGIVYHVETRQGAYLNPGDLVANVGKLDRMRVTVYVDEPELGRVQAGMPVAITWDAKPGREWTGTVEQVPTQIVALGSRQVGEVICLVDNPNHELLPGTNVNAEIQTETVENSLTIPREALRRQGNQTGVFVLEGSIVRWRPIRTGAQSVTRVQVLEGLAEGDAVALPTGSPLADGVSVEANLR
jgi:multidrug efflux pump subunit AcrA (membrane-fusion protein)